MDDSYTESLRIKIQEENKKVESLLREQKYIEESQFINNNYLTTLIIPSNIQEIKRFSFKNCKRLVSLIIPHQVYLIDNNAFEGCENLIKITIPRSVERIRDNVFKDCIGLKIVIIENGVKHIHQTAFENCGIVYLEIPNTIHSIHWWAFQNCKNITKIHFKNYTDLLTQNRYDWDPTAQTGDGEKTYLYIDKKAFLGCTNIKEISGINKEIENVEHIVWERGYEDYRSYIVDDEWVHELEDITSCIFYDSKVPINYNSNIEIYFEAAKKIQSAYLQARYNPSYKINKKITDDRCYEYCIK